MIKNKLPIIYISGILLISIICGASFRQDNHKQYAQPAAVALHIHSMPLPESVAFCGETVDLKRYDLRERYDRELNSLVYLHATTMLQIKRANRYFPLIEPVLKKHGVPDDFKYLAVIESMLDIRAHSPAKAAGLWQFIVSTGKLYGLEISPQVDERYHVEKSTEAACRYLLDAYGKFGSWINVAASYNAGMQRINDGLGKQRVTNVLDLALPEETSRYVFRIMAMKTIFSSPARYGFVLKGEDLYTPIRMKEVKVTEKTVDLVSFAKKNGIDYLHLKNFNIWLRDTALTVAGKPYVIQIPLEEDLYHPGKRMKVHDKNWTVD
jgi:hypothetical protein